MPKKIYITNSRGEREPFSLRKVYNSARSVGASKELASKIAFKIQEEVFPEISTSEIFDRIFEILFEQSPHSAIVFNLKRGMAKLGPTGFPFEKYVGKIFATEGFKVKLNQIIPGFCTHYEIDFLAKKENLIYIGECKYHNLPGGMVDLQVALANYARFLDIKSGKFLNSGLNYKSFLVTNTKFTQEAIKYSECVGVKLLGWKYPPEMGFEKIIEKNQLFPITILPSISSQLAKTLINAKIVLVKNIFKNNFEKLAPKINISKARVKRILVEAKILFRV